MDRDTLPLQEVHPVIAGADIAAEIAACALFWNRRPLTGLLVRLVPPVAATALVSGTSPAAGAASPDPAGGQPEPGEDGSAPGPAGAPPGPGLKPSINLGIRAAGDALTLWGAWRRSPPMILAGAAVIAFGWSVNVVGPGAGAGPVSE